MSKVVVVLPRLMHYRVDFFERLRARASRDGVEIRVLHGQASPAESRKRDAGTLSWADTVHNHYLRIGGTDLVWQPLPTHLRNAELLILAHESRVISNYPVLLRRRLGGRSKVAWWGHGANLQSKSRSGPRERWKRWLAAEADYWFAYTRFSVDLLVHAGVPENRITSVDNAVDTHVFRAQCDAVTEAETASLRAQLGIPPDAPVALFCGSLYPDKRPDLLLASGDLIKRRIPDFHLVVVGSGPSEGELLAESRERPWMHMVGVQRSAAKAVYFRLSRVMLNPGVLGLHILDAFCAGLPLVSTKGALHGPEIVYLDDGVNGILTDDNVEDYAEAAIRVLSDRDLGRSIAASARQASAVYTLEAMVDRFLNGVHRALAMERQPLRPAALRRRTEFRGSGA
jgi:glycosyltransferase involved in cell wall biosynthesis